MNKVLKLVFLILVVGSIISCSKPSQPNGNMFEVGVDELTSVQANQPFQITGYLKNTSKYSWKITHGAGLFTYELYDMNGDNVPSESKMRFQNDIGLLNEINSNEAYRNNYGEHRSREFFEFVIHEPGQYRVKAKAEFTISHEQKDYEFEIFSDNYEFTVE